MEVVSESEDEKTPDFELNTFDDLLKIAKQYKTKYKEIIPTKKIYKIPS